MASAFNALGLSTFFLLFFFAQVVFICALLVLIQNIAFENYFVVAGIFEGVSFLFVFEFLVLIYTFYLSILTIFDDVIRCPFLMH